MSVNGQTWGHWTALRFQPKQFRCRYFIWPCGCVCVCVCVDVTMFHDQIRERIYIHQAHECRTKCTMDRSRREKKMNRKYKTVRINYGNCGHGMALRSVLPLPPAPVHNKCKQKNDAKCCVHNKFVCTDMWCACVHSEWVTCRWHECAIDGHPDCNWRNWSVYDVRILRTKYTSICDIQRRGRRRWVLALWHNSYWLRLVSYPV